MARPRRRARARLMEYRELGSPGLKASVIGLGAWMKGGWKSSGAEDRKSPPTIRPAIDLDVNLMAIVMKSN